MAVFTGLKTWQMLSVPLSQGQTGYVGRKNTEASDRKAIFYDSEIKTNMLF